MELNDIIFTVWLSIGLVIYCLIYLTLNWLSISKVDLASGILAAILIMFCPLGLITYISLYRKASVLYLPPSMRLRNVAFSKFSIADLMLFEAWHICEKENLSYFDATERLLNTNAIKDKFEVTSFFSTRYSDFILYKHVRKLQENE